MQKATSGNVKLQKFTTVSSVPLEVNSKDGGEDKPEWELTRSADAAHSKPEKKKLLDMRNSHIKIGGLLGLNGVLVVYL